MTGPQTLRTLFGDSLMFGLGRLTAVLASVVLVPVYTRYFSVSDYGVIENLNVFLTILASLFGLALPDALFRHYPLAETEDGRRSVVATCSLLSLGSGAVAVLASAAVSPWFGSRFLQRTPPESLAVTSMVGVLAFVTVQSGLLLAVLRISFRRRDYVVSAVAGVVSSLLLSVVCVVWLGLGPIGPFVGAAVGTATVYVVVAARTGGLFAASAFDAGLARRLLAFSLPLVPVALFLFIVRSSDRYFITLLLQDPLHQVGLYVTAEKVTAPLLLIGTGFALAWAPFAMHAGKQANAVGLFREAFGLYVALTSLGLVALASIARAVLGVFTPAEYHASYVFVPVLGLYAAVSSLHYVGAVGLILTGRTRLGMPILGIAAVVNLALNALLIPRFGVFGAAWATVASFLLYDLLIFRLSERLFFVGFPIGRGLAAYAASFAAATMTLGRPLVGVVALAGQLAVLVALGLVSGQRLVSLWTWVTGARGRGSGRAAP